MEKSHITPTDRSRRPENRYLPLIPLAWIAVLLAAWFLIVEWRMLPDLISATMAALP